MVKRMLALAAMMLWCAAMTACGGADNTPSPDDTTTPTTAVVKQEAETIVIGTAYTDTDAAVTFSVFKVSTNDKIVATIDDKIYFENSHDGKTYVDVVMDVTNEGEQAVASHELLSVTAKGADETAYSSVLFATETANNTELVQFEDVVPGQTVRLHAAVEINESETALTLTVAAGKKTYTLDYTPGEECGSAKEIKIGNTVKSAVGNALTLSSVNYSGEVNPTNTEGYYSYYSVKDESNAYIHVEMNILNGGSEPLPVSEAVGVTVAYPDGRRYNGFTVVEAEDQKGFVTDAQIASGEVTRVLYLIEAPTVAQRTEVDLIIAFGTDEHHIVIGLPASE